MGPRGMPVPAARPRARGVQLTIFSAPPPADKREWGGRPSRPAGHSIAVAKGHGARRQAAGFITDTHWRGGMSRGSGPRLDGQPRLTLGCHRIPGPRGGAEAGRAEMCVWKPVEAAASAPTHRASPRA